MKFVLLIAVFCVVPCAFQDVWDDYDTWYDEFNNLDDGGLAINLDQPKDDEVNEPEPVENDDNKEFHAADYGGDDNYKDYEIEDNRDEVKNKLENEPNQEQDIEDNDDNYESAVQDFDAFQQIINNDKLKEDVIDKILDVDEKSQMDLNDLLPGNPDVVPEIALDEEDKPNSNDPIFEENNESKQDQEIAADQNEDSEEKSDKGIQSNIEDVRNETQLLLEEFGSVFDDEASDKTKDVLPELIIEPDLQDTVDETRHILENTNINFDESKDTKEEEKNADLSLVQIRDHIKRIINETQDGLEKSINEFDENKDAKDDQKIAEVEANIKDIVDETRQILEDTNSEFDESQNNKEGNQNVEEAVKDDPVLEVEENSDDDENTDKIYEDLNEDLDNLFETWKKLSLDDNDEVDDNSDNADNDKVEVNADDDFNRDYLNIGDDAKDTDFDYEGEARILAARNDYYDSIKDKDLSDLFNDFESDDASDEQFASSEVVKDVNDDIPALYGNDGLVAESNENNQQNETNDYVPNQEENEGNMKTSSSEKSEEVEQQQVEEKTSVEESKQTKATKDVDELTSSELDELSKQFVMLHDSEIKLARDDTPIHITLTSNEPVVIASPNYPNSYPTDQTVVDWILEGLGTGIEVNVTDLAINSAQGHFLMLKPGQSDASGDSGIVFAYRINSERRYRFRDVNRLFVRFNPLGGMSFSKGFQLSARMIEPPAGETGEDLSTPEPEFLVPEPQHTATLLLAGVNSTGFLELKDEFQRLLADMATMYINANDIDPGMNTTNVVTQITRSYVCNINWPGFESCVEVTFGVPLIYEDEDAPSRLTESELMEMWDTYASRDPFATRLSQMGVSDYMVPREAKILTVWVVIGVGVVIAAAMLAFALWRYSCIENYTRMQEFSDTDSIHDKKRGLDMYPTPHQTLPPLYTENDYKWADRTFDDSTRVDMGGFTNNNFTRDEPSSESEDDVVVSRDRNSFKPRDFNVV